ncbi:MAG: hypothetical protein JW819_10750 [Candidatus Krumholzibacteriota bacterium]|nr:hypothetical protein [Candidatus Krumholzibacteriota bacterium]
MDMMERLMNLDRRWLYLLVGLAAVIPILAPLNLPVNVSRPVQDLFDRVESLEPGEIIMVSFDYGPSTGPENDPMGDAIILHALARDLRVVVIALYPLGGVTEAREELERCVGDLDPPNGQIASERFPDKVYGRDFIYFGYKDGGLAAMRLMSDNMHEVFPADFYGTPLDEYELGREVQGYDNVAFVMSLATGIIGEWWANLVNAQFGTPVAVGCTAVSAPKYFAYYRAGQMFALLAGLKGAAEYEFLVSQKYPQLAQITDSFIYNAGKGWDVQSVVYSIITLFIIIGNVAFIVERRRQKRGM